MSSSLSSFKQKVPEGYSVGRIQQFTPEQMDLFKNAFSHLSPDSWLSKMASGDQSFFEDMEKPALKQFGALQGNIASRFSGMGMGGRRSSGFQNTMNSAASDFAQGLQSKRQELTSQALKDLMTMSDSLMKQQPFENSLIKKQHKKSFLEQILPMFSDDPVGGGVENMDKIMKLMMMMA